MGRAAGSICFPPIPMVVGLGAAAVARAHGSVEGLLSLRDGEVTALNLVKIDLEGHEIDPSPYTVNRAGFVIHSAIHGARPEDAHCVIHTHSTPGVAVACKEEGLRMDNFYSIFLYGQIAYHPFEGKREMVEY